MKPGKGKSAILTYIAAIALGAIVVIIPLGYFLASYQRSAGAIEAEAEISASLISPLISMYPETWKYNHDRLKIYLSSRPKTGQPEARRILALQNEVVFEVADPLPAPRITRSYDLFDSGRLVGRIEVSRSVRPLLWRAASILLLTLPAGAAVFIVLSVLPLKALSRAEESLRETKEFLEKVMESTTNAIIVVNTDGKIIHCNAQAADISGHSRAELLTAPFYSLLTPSATAAARRSLHKILAGEEKVVKFETDLIRKDGRTVNIACGASPFFERGAIRGAVLSAENITEKKRLEKELLKARQLESLGILAGGIAHDYNNLLAVILGNLSIAKGEVPPREQLYKLLVNAERASLKAKELTGRFATFSRGGDPVKKALSLTPLLTEAMTSLCADTDAVRCELSAADDLWPLEADENQLRQVMTNMLANAKDAMPGGGAIEIRARNVLDLSAEGVPLETKRYIKISIKDEGSGIPEESLPKIFDPYFTTKEMGDVKGRGLGLSICHSIVRRHGGLITVESKVGSGTTFHLYLPAA